MNYLSIHGSYQILRRITDICDKTGLYTYYNVNPHEPVNEETFNPNGYKGVTFGLKGGKDLPPDHYWWFNGSRVNYNKMLNMNNINDLIQLIKLIKKYG